MRSLLFLLPFLFACRASFALVVEPTAVESQLKSATLVAEIDVLELKGAADREGSLSYRARVRVDRVLQAHPDGGDFPAEGDTIFLRGLGGEANGMGEYLTGYARPRVGRRYQAHLVRQDADFAVTGFEFGLVAIDGLREFSRNRTDGSNGEGTGAFLYWAKNYLPVTYAISAKSFLGFADYIAAIDASFQAWQSPTASRMAFLAVGLFAWLIVQFAAALHGFTNLWAVLAGMIATFFLLAVVTALALALLGVDPTVVSGPI